MKIKLKPLEELLNTLEHTINSSGHIYFEDDRGGIHPKMKVYFGTEINVREGITAGMYVGTDDHWTYHKSWFEGHPAPVKTKFCTIEDV